MVNYKFIRKNGKSYLEHRWIMEQHLGRELTDDEVVHHINENITDNRIENLEVMKRRDHTLNHIDVVGCKDRAIEMKKKQLGYRRERVKGDRYMCTKCKEIKHSSEFYKNVTYWNGLQSWCKVCRNILEREGVRARLKEPDLGAKGYT